MSGISVCHADDLLRLNELYEIALKQDPSLQAATFAREAAMEARPQALAQFLPQLTAGADVTRERVDFYRDSQLTTFQSVNCALRANGNTQRCDANGRGVQLQLTQKLWSFENFSQLKQAALETAAAQATVLQAQQDLMLRVAVAYFAILSAADQLTTNRSERQAFET